MSYELCAVDKKIHVVLDQPRNCVDSENHKKKPVTTKGNPKTGSERSG